MAERPGTTQPRPIRIQGHLNTCSIWTNPFYEHVVGCNCGSRNPT